MERHKRQNEKVLRYFVEASIQTYGTIAYLCKGDRSAIEMANRVARLNKNILPGLELLAAVV